MADRRVPIDERVSDPPERDGGRAALIGCAVSVVVVFVIVGAVGLGVGGYSRFAGDAPGTTPGDPRADVADDGASDPPFAPRAPATDPLADMRRRYVIGPHVRLEGMIPSPTAIRDPVTGRPRPWTRGRSADTPWDVLGATYETAPAPAPFAPPAPVALLDPRERTDRPLVTLAGVPLELRVRAADASGGPGIVRYVVSFDGYRGHFSLPATVPTELGLVSAGGSDGASVRFLIGAPARPDGTLAGPGQSITAVMRVAAVDDQDRVSPYVTRQLDILPVGTGDVEVALTMSEPTDLDLYVTDPTGATIWYGNTSGATGGHLDLDANAACSGNMGVDN